MRTLSEIIDAAKEGEPTTREECLYALLAYSALHHFDHMEVLDQAERPEAGRLSFEWRRDESYRRFKVALGKSPKEWLGWNNDPANPEYVQRIKSGKRLLEAFMDRRATQQETP